MTSLPPSEMQPTPDQTPHFTWCAFILDRTAGCNCTAPRSPEERPESAPAKISSTCEVIVGYERDVPQWCGATTTHWYPVDGGDTMALCAVHRHKHPYASPLPESVQGELATTGTQLTRCQKCGEEGLPSPTFALDLHTQIEGLSDENHFLRDEAADWKRTADTATARIAQLETQLADARKWFQHAEEERAKLQASLADWMRAALYSAPMINAARAFDPTNPHAWAEGVRSDIDALMSERDRLQGQLASRTLEYEEMREDAVRLRRINAVLNEPGKELPPLEAIYQIRRIIAPRFTSLAERLEPAMRQLKTADELLAKIDSARHPASPPPVTDQ